MCLYVFIDSSLGRPTRRIHRNTCRRRRRRTRSRHQQHRRNTCRRRSIRNRHRPRPLTTNTAATIAAKTRTTSEIATLPANCTRSSRPPSRRSKTPRNRHCSISSGKSRKTIVTDTGRRRIPISTKR